MRCQFRRRRLPATGDGFVSRCGSAPRGRPRVRPDRDGQLLVRPRRCTIFVHLRNRPTGHPCYHVVMKDFNAEVGVSSACLVIVIVISMLKMWCSASCWRSLLDSLIILSIGWVHEESLQFFSEIDHRNKCCPDTKGMVVSLLYVFSASVLARFRSPVDIAAWITATLGCDNVDLTPSFRVDSLNHGERHPFRSEIKWATPTPRKAVLNMKITWVCCRESVSNSRSWTKSIQLKVIA